MIEKGKIVHHDRPELHQSDRFRGCRLTDLPGPEPVKTNGQLPGKYSRIKDFEAWGLDSIPLASCLYVQLASRSLAYEANWWRPQGRDRPKHGG
jgi:hypothetical protein